MKKGYLFICNYTKPTKEQYESLEPISINTFGYAPVKAAELLGYELYYSISRAKSDKVKCTNFDVKFYDAHIYRNIFAFKDNWIAYKNLVKLLKEHPEIEVIHCNTPIGGVLGRICGHKFKKKVIYTAHGFHFFKGAPFLYWLLFYTIEKVLARWTDVLITINGEDYERARSFHLKNNGKLYHIPGVGIDLSMYESEKYNRDEIRKSLCLRDEDIAIISMGDLVDRKNYAPAIRAIYEAHNTKLHLFICGDGVLRLKLQRITNELGIDNQVHFLGHRSDITALLFGMDVFFLSSKQEGLPRSLMEGMASGLPCVASKIRGNTDLIKDGEGGYLCEVNDSKGYAAKLNELANSAEKRFEMGNHNLKEIQNYQLSKVCDQMLKIYEENLKD